MEEAGIAAVNGHSTALAISRCLFFTECEHQQSPSLGNRTESHRDGPSGASVSLKVRESVSLVSALNRLALVRDLKPDIGSLNARWPLIPMPSN